jgi:hypothetical protein
MKKLLCNFSIPQNQRFCVNSILGEELIWPSSFSVQAENYFQLEQLNFIQLASSI